MIIYYLSYHICLSSHSRRNIVLMKLLIKVKAELLVIVNVIVNVIVIVIVIVTRF